MVARNSELMFGESGWLVRNEVAALEQAYEAGDILGMPAQCLIGTEIDFCILMNKQTPDQKDALEKTRSAIEIQLGALVPKNEEQAARKAGWLAQIPDLTPEELINYNIYRRLSVPTLDPPTSHMYLSADDAPERTLEFVFGNGLYQTGYYDNPGSFEMRTQAAKPTIAMRRVQRVITVADEVARSYGASFRYTNDQTNFSVWVPTKDGMQPVHSLRTAKGQEVARKATAGILHALRDGAPILRPASAIMDGGRPLKNSAGPGRGVTVRVTPDRFEQRRAVHEDNHALGALMLMSGFAHGVADPNFDTSFVTKEPQNLLVPADGFDKVRDLHFLRGLQESNIANDHFVFQGMSELAYERIESMLASITGVPVHERRNGNIAIRALLGCISVNAAGELQVDELAFEETLKHNEHYITLKGTPNETITDRLKRIQFIRGIVIKGNVTATWPAGATYHKELRDAIEAPSLGFIGRHTLNVIQENLSARFTHEEGVALYFQQKFGDGSDPVSEKMAHIKELAAQFPDADHDEVVRLIIQETEKMISFARTSMTLYTNRSGSDKDYMYKHWKELCEEGVELLWALKKYQPDSKVSIIAQ